MIPLMAGLLVASIASGPGDQPDRQYKAFPIAGTALLVVGMSLLSRLGVGTAPWLASAYMVVVGVGIGLVMQVLVLVVQNDAPARRTWASPRRRRRSSARSAAPSASRCSARSSPRGSPTSSELLPASSAKVLGGGVHINPEQAKHLPPEVHAQFLHAFSHALNGVFIWGTGDRGRSRSRSRGS